MRYYVAERPNKKGEYEVHTETCKLLPTAGERGYLGLRESGWDAIEKAKKDQTKAVGCRFCLSGCYEN